MRLFSALSLLAMSGCSLFLDSGNDRQEPTCTDEDCPVPAPLPPGFPMSLLERYPCLGLEFPEPVRVQVSDDGGPQDNVDDISLTREEESIVYRDSNQLYIADNPSGPGALSCDSGPCFVFGEPLGLPETARRPKISWDGTSIRYADDTADGQAQEVKEILRTTQGQFGPPMYREQYGKAEEVSPPPARKSAMMEIWVLDGVLTTDGIDTERAFLVEVSDSANGIEDLWYSSDLRVLVVAGGGEFDKLSMFVRGEVGEPWFGPVDLGEAINGPDGDTSLDNESPWLSDNLCVLYFSSRLDGADSFILRTERGPVE